jgi:SAM-dependent methyltransferase
MQQDPRNIFNDFALEYFTYRPYLPRDFGARLVETLELQSPASLLEIGCGTGQATEAFSNFPFRLVALDLGPALLDYAKRRDFGKLAVEFVCSSFEAFDSKRESFDLVFSSMAIHWVETTVAYAKAAALLRPGGHLVVINIKRAYPPSLLEQLDPLYDEFPEIKGPHPSSSFASAEATIEREKFFQTMPPLEFSWSIDYTPASYVGLMKTMSPQRSLVASRQQEYFRKLELVLAKHSTFTIPQVASAKIFIKK